MEDDLLHSENEDIIYDLYAWTKKVREKTCLVFVYLNLDSIKHKFEILCAQLTESIRNLDIIAIAELKITREEYENTGQLYKLEGYNRVALCREYSAGGGLLIYVRETIKFKRIVINLEHSESILIIVEQCGKNVGFLFIYRPPGRAPHEFIVEIVREIKKFPRMDIIMCGDVNIDISSETFRTEEYENELSALGMERKISSYTREAMRQNNITRSCLDHIYHRGKQEVQCGVFRTKISDHYMVCGAVFERAFEFQMRADAFRTESVTDLTTFRNELYMGLERTVLENIREPDELYCMIEKVFRAAKQRATSIRQTKKRQKPIKPWMNVDILNKIKERDALFSRCRRRNISAVEQSLRYEEYVHMRNAITADIRRAKRKYYADLFAKYKNNMKETWRLINEVTGGRERVKRTDWVQRFGESEEEIAEAFATNFVRQVDDLIKRCDLRAFVRDAGAGSHCGSVYLPPVDVESACAVLKSMDAKKAPGIDDISAKLIIEAADILLPVLLMLMNASLDCQCVPGGLKTAIVKPIYKSGERNDYRNYRPISILPTIDKMMERYVHGILSDYLEGNELIDKRQYGFRRGKGTIQLLEDFNDLMADSLNHRMHVICVFVDFSKAFDTINRTKMVEAMENVGVRGRASEWLRNYLTDRSFLVQIGDSLSKKRSSRHGVAQGSILGPLMYTLYVNDIGSCFGTCKYYLYADDTVIISIHKDFDVAEARLNEEYLVLFVHLT